jgi:hypothetical protein
MHQSDPILIHYITYLLQHTHSNPSSLLFATCSLPFLDLPTSHHPSAHTHFGTLTLTRARPSPRHSLLTLQTKHPSRSHQQFLHCCFFRLDASTYLLHPPPRATTQDNASLRSCLCLALPLYAPCRWRQLKPPETRQRPPGNLLVPDAATTTFCIPVYTISQHRGTTLLAASPYHMQS